MKKNLVFFCLPLLLSACTGSHYYFNKRIGHAGAVNKPVPEQETMAETVAEPSKTDTLCPVTDWLSETAGDSASARIKATPVQPATADNRPLVKVAVARSEIKEAATQQKPAVRQSHRITIAPSAAVSGWGIFWIVVGAIIVLTFFVALALGYTAAQALGYAFLAPIVVALCIFYLIFVVMAESSGSDCDDDNDDNDDDNDDD